MIADSDWEIDRGTNSIKWTGDAGRSVTVTEFYDYMKDLSRQDDLYDQQREDRKKFIETLKQL